VVVAIEEERGGYLVIKLGAGRGYLQNYLNTWHYMVCNAITSSELSGLRIELRPSLPRRFTTLSCHVGRKTHGMDWGSPQLRPSLPLISLVVIGGRDISSARRVSVVVRATVKRLGCLLLVLILLLILFGILPILLEVVIWR
jgi:hypothetical protein